MQCPHCTINIYEDDRRLFCEDHQPEWGLEDGDGNNVFLYYIQCPACSRMILRLEEDHYRQTIYPSTTNRPPLSEHVPEQYQEDYREAALVLAASPKASAALSRRCLQAVLRDQAGVGPGNLYSEIEATIEKGDLPAHIVESLHTLRQFGNAAAHPTKNANTGEIVPIDPNEAEWCLDVLDLLFDFYFVKPKQTAERIAAFKEKTKGPAQGH